MIYVHSAYLEHYNMSSKVAKDEVLVMTNLYLPWNLREDVWKSIVACWKCVSVHKIYLIIDHCYAH